MYNITLIGTHHSQIGKCNADELYKIIESISPAVIFVDLSPYLLDRISIENQIADEVPELRCNKKYSLDHNIKLIGVDIDLDQNFPWRDIQNMLAIFKRDNVYKELENEQYKMTKKDGFAFLNSEKLYEFG